MSLLKVVTKPSEVDELIAHCQKTRTCSFDFETSGLQYYSHTEYPLMCGVSFQPGSAWIIPMGHKDSPPKIKKRWHKLFKRFAAGVLENPDVIKVAWNLKFEYKWCIRLGIIMRGRLFDTMLAKYLLDEERPHDLKDFVFNMFPKYGGYEDNIDKRIPWADKDFNKLAKYCGIDCDMTLRGMIYLEPILIKQKFYNLFRNMLMGLTKVLAETEYSGFPINKDYLLNLSKEYKDKLKKSEEKLHDIRPVRKFEKLHANHRMEQMIKKVQLEIRELRGEDAQRNARMIANREVKIKNILEGKINKKQEYNGINFGSPQQLVEFLFTSPHGLKLKIIKYTKNKNKKPGTPSRAVSKKPNPSTDEEVLEKLKKKDKTGFMEALLEHRGLSKLDSTYISGMVPHLDRFSRIHAGFKINGTVTCRLSCVEPNLQNIPRDTTASEIKKMFIPPPGYLLVEPDYSQAELRIIAELSEDKAMIEIFKKNYNIHVATACKMNGGLLLYEKVKGLIKKGDDLGGEELKKPEHKELLFWQKQKKKGKSLNFSIVYQQGDEATAEDLEVSVEEAAEFKRAWFKEFPDVKRWIDKTKKQAKRDEYVTNIFGFKRRLHNIHDERPYFRAEAERQAVNAPIQGGSGYFTTFAMIVMREKILTGEFPKDMIFAYTVHDSIGIFIRPKDIHKVMPEIIKICDNPQTQEYFGFSLKHVTMKVSAEVGKVWSELKAYDPWEDYSKWVY